MALLFGDSTIEPSVDTDSPTDFDAWKFVATSSGTCDTLEAYITTKPATGSVYIACYADAAGVPGALLCYATLPVAGITLNAFNSGATNTAPAIVSGTAYWIAVWPTTGTVSIRYNTGTGPGNYYRALTGGNPPASTAPTGGVITANQTASVRAQNIGGGFTVAINDSLGVTDARTTLATSTRTVSDNLAITDAITPLLSGAKITPVARISLAPSGVPTTQTSHSIEVRARKASGTGTVTLRAALYEGSTNRSGDLESSALTTSLADYSLAVSDANAAAITSYSDLELRFWGYSSTGDAVNVEVALINLKTPAVTGGASLTQTVADNLAITDSSTRLALLPAAIADNLAVTDARTILSTYIRTVADPLAIADTQSLVQSGTQTSPAWISLAPGNVPDTRDRHVIRVRARKTAGTGTVTLRVALFEGATNRTGNLETAALTTSLADYALTIPDVVAATITDYSNLELHFWGFSATRDIADVAVANIFLETPTGPAVSAFTQSVDDALGVTDTPATLTTYQRTIADALAITDLNTRSNVILLTKAINDVIALTDLIAPSKTVLATHNEVAGPIPVIMVVPGAIVRGYGTVTGTGSVGTNVLVKSLADVIALTDTPQVNINWPVSIADNIAVTDLRTGLIIVQKSLADVIALTDGLATFSSSTGLAQLISDSLGVQDVANRIVDYKRPFSELLTVHDLAYLGGSVVVYSDFGYPLSISLEAVAPHSMVLEQVERLQMILDQKHTVLVVYLDQNFVAVDLVQNKLTIEDFKN